MNPTFVSKAHKHIRPRLPGVILVSVIHCVPIYVMIWYFSLIDDMSARISISLLVAMLPVAELLPEPRPLKSRGEQYWLALFFGLGLLLVASHEFNWHGWAMNAAVSVTALPYGWLVWKLMRRSWLLLTALMLALALMMAYWAAALAGDDDWFGLLLLPLLVVLLGGIIWAPAVRQLLDSARLCKDRPMSGPGMQALAMFMLFLPVSSSQSPFPGCLTWAQPGRRYP